MARQPVTSSSSRNPNVEEDLNIFGRIVIFVRQVIGELKKVVWPTREQWWTYFLVVLVFVLAIMAFTGLLDLLFGKLMVWIFT